MRDRDRDRDWSAYRMGVSSGGGPAPEPAARLFRRSTNFTNATTTFATVFTFEAAANSTYLLKVRARQESSASTTGVHWKVSGVTAISADAFSTWATQFTADASSGLAKFIVGEAAFDPGTAIAAAHFCTGEILIVTGASGGTINIQAAAETTGTVTVHSGSTCEVRDITSVGTLSRITGSALTNSNSAVPTDAHSVVLPATGYTLIECNWNQYTSDVGGRLVWALADLPSGATAIFGIWGGPGTGAGPFSGGIGNPTSIFSEVSNTTDTFGMRRLTILVRTTGTGGTCKIQFRRHNTIGTQTVNVGSWCWARPITPTDVKTSTQVIDDNTLVNVLSAAVEAGKSYSIIGATRTLTTGGDGTGVDVAWAGVPAGADLLSNIAHGKSNDGARPISIHMRTDNTLIDSATGFFGAGTAGVPTFIDGSLVVGGTGGTLVQQMSSEDTNDVTVEVNSFMHADELELVDAG